MATTQLWRKTHLFNVIKNTKVIAQANNESSTTDDRTQKYETICTQNIIQNYFNALRNNSLNLGASKMSQAISSSSRNFLSKQFTHTFKEWNVPFYCFDSRNSTTFFFILFLFFLEMSIFYVLQMGMKKEFPRMRWWAWQSDKVCTEVVCNSWKLEFAFRWILIISFPSQF